MILETAFSLGETVEYIKEPGCVFTVEDISIYIHASNSSRFTYGIEQIGSYRFLTVSQDQLTPVREIDRGLALANPEE